MIDSLCDQAGGGEYCSLLLRLPFPARTDNQHHGSYSEAASESGGIAEDLREAFQKAKKEVGGRGPQLADLMGTLRTTIASLPRVSICVHALDECLPKCLPELLESLGISSGSPLAREHSSPGGPMSGKIFKDISPRRS